MSSVKKKLEYERSMADLTAIEKLISNVDKNDALARLGLESRLNELKGKVARLAEFAGSELASAAIYFGGKPVISNKGIESNFASEIIEIFQDLVSKVMAETLGPLGSRGKVPKKELSKLHITDITRGSFGFVFEELDEQSYLFDTGLKSSVDTSLELIEAFVDADDEELQELLKSCDQRVVDSIESFFQVLDDNEARVRLVNEKLDKSIYEPQIKLGLSRASSISYEEGQKELVGKLTGAMSYEHSFEMLIDDNTVKGKISRGISAQEIEKWAKTLLGKEVSVHVHFKEIRRNNELRGLAYILNSLSGAP